MWSVWGWGWGQGGGVRGVYTLRKESNENPTLVSMQTKNSQPEGKQIMSEMRFTELRHYPLTRGLVFPSLHQRQMLDYFSYL